MARRRALPPYVSEDVAKATGQVRLYYRRPGQPKIRIWFSVEQEGFWPAYEAAKRGEQLPKPGRTRSARPAGVPTFRSICEAYFQSAEFKQLTPISQRTRRGILRHCWNEETKKGSGLFIGDTPLHEFGPAHVKVLRDRKSDKPEAANNRVKAIRGVFKWHLGKAGQDKNPCREFDKLKSANPDGFHTWTMDEVAAFEARHPIGTTARLAFDLALYTAQRRSDVVRLGPADVKIVDGVAFLDFMQQKVRKTRVVIPIISPLADSISARPNTEGTTFLLTSYGKPFTANGIGNAFREWCDAAKLPQCSMHGLRKATLSRLAELGIGEDALGSVSGHVPGSKELPIYTRAARRRIMAADALKKLEESLKPAMKLSHLDFGPTENGTISEGENL